jgi:hypothetical protein
LADADDNMKSASGTLGIAAAKFAALHSRRACSERPELSMIRTVGAESARYRGGAGLARRIGSRAALLHLLTAEFGPKRPFATVNCCIAKDSFDDPGCNRHDRWRKSLFDTEFFGVCIEQKALTSNEPNFQQGSRPIVVLSWDSINERVTFEQCPPYGRKIVSAPHQFRAQPSKSAGTFVGHFGN